MDGSDTWVMLPKRVIQKLYNALAEAIRQLMSDVAQQPQPNNYHNPRLSHRAPVLPGQTLALRPHTWVALLIFQKRLHKRGTNWLCDYNKDSAQFIYNG
ncbi:hypothetical protein CDAR_391071 [Caerostris darwini]|uniref:Uncharacterized protein n=1 Tax=Caerostris darwini TaxID=1538125 RepID=A0AAV4UAJ3_9ARAC|nr:hypothetical protein CDAR_391071 [Caerostris darwini]